MILGIACTVALGVIALWQARRVAHWVLVARILGRDVVVERAKRRAIAIVLGEIAAALAREDRSLAAAAMRTAIRIAEDDTDEALVKLERIG